MTELTLKELAKAGLVFLIMGIAIFVLYNKVDEELQILRIETKECSESYKNLLLNQLNENTKVIEKNNQIIYTFNQKHDYDNQR